MRRRRGMAAVLIAVAAMSIGSYALARSRSTFRASGWFGYAPLAQLASVRRNERLILRIANPAAAGTGDLAPTLNQHREGTRGIANLIAPGHTTDFGASNIHPDLAALGPVTTDLRRAATTTTSVVVPQVTNLDLDAAYARLHLAGLRVSFPHSFSDGPFACLPTIARESLRAGRRIGRGSLVTLQP
ncbi:MAG: hypothetical protein ACR2LV_09030 [Solirubrobacteraceae bacterium]